MGADAERKKSQRSVHFGGTAPLGVEPDENAEGAYFYGARPNHVEIDDAAVMDCRNVCAPYQPARSDQTAQAHFGRDGNERPGLAFSFTARLRHRRIDRLLRQVEIALPAPIPAHIVSLLIFRHCRYSAMRTALGARY